MAEPKTRSELCERVLQILGVAMVGQASAAEDVHLVDAQIDSVIESLAGERIAYIGNPDAIPLAAYQSVAVYVADAVSSDFGRPGAMRVPEPDGSSRLDKAERTLRRINSGQSSGSHQVVEYF